MVGRGENGGEVDGGRRAGGAGLCRRWQTLAVLPRCGTTPAFSQMAAILLQPSEGGLKGVHALVFCTCGCCCSCRRNQRTSWRLQRT